MNNSKSSQGQEDLFGKRLAISVKEARKLLGKDFKKISDKQVEDIIVKLDLICKGFINQSVST